MPKVHARFSASSAKAWLSCGGYIAFNDYSKDEDVENEYEKEGTEAHALAEKILKGLYLGAPKIRKKKCYDQEMYYYVRTYVDYVSNLKEKLTRKYGKENVDIKIEQRLDFSNVIPEGFGTGDCIILTPAELHIVDLKFGKGIAVPAFQNPQLMLYGLGALNQYDTLYDIQTVVLHIAQVRMEEFSSYEISVKELEDWAEVVNKIALSIYNGKVEYHQGVDQCRWCKGRYICSERCNQLLNPIKKIIKQGGDDL